MKIRMKVSDFNVDTGLNMEILVNMEDFYAMLDGVSARTITDYIYIRLKAAGEEGGAR